MGFINTLSHFLVITQQPLVQTAITQSFTLESWCQDSAFDRQPISWYHNSGHAGYFGIEIRGPNEPIHDEKRAIFTRNSSHPESLFFQRPGKTSNTDDFEEMTVIVKPDGAVTYCSPPPWNGYKDLKPYMGNFSTDYFTYWPDRKSYDNVDWQVPGSSVGNGVFLACPAEVGDADEENRKGYYLYAMTPYFKRGGCITLEWLVQSPIDGGETVGILPVVEEHAAL